MGDKPKTVRFLKYQITRIENKAKNSANMSIYSLRHYLEELETCFSEFTSMYGTEAFDEEMGAEFDEYDTKYESAKSMLMTRIDDLTKEQVDGSGIEPGENEKILTGILQRQNDLVANMNRLCSGSAKNDSNKLPILKIPVFKGDLKEWTKFKNLFMSIVDRNANLSSTEKLNHLLSLVEGEPLSMIKHYPVVGNNYKDAWATLIQEYDNNYVLIRSLIGTVIDAPRVDSKQGSIRSLWSLLTETIHALENMGEYGNTRDPWIIYAIVSKFDRQTAEKWAEVVVGDNEPDVNTLITFLRDLCSSERLLGESVQQKYVESRRPLKGLSATVRNCFVCGDLHNIFKCARFMKLSVKDREALVKRESRCINCFGSGHFSTKCTARGSCFHCRKRHHTLLHYHNAQRTDQKVSEATATKEVVDKDLLHVNSSVSSRGSSAILPTAVVEILNGIGQYVKCRLLLDSGSQASFITESFFKRLMLNRSKVKVPVQFMSGTVSFYSKGAVSTVFRSRHNVEKKCSVLLHILPKLMEQLPERKLEFGSVPNLKKKFQLADEDFEVPDNIDVIIGADLFFGIIGPGKYYHQIDKIWVQESILGWIISGGSESTTDNTLSVNSIWQTKELNGLLEKFWLLEEQPGESLVNEIDEKCDEHFRKTTRRKKNGQYSVDLPLKDSEVDIGESFHGALNRFHALERRFRKDRAYKAKYCNLVNTFENDGYLERIPKNELTLPVSKRFYLPHYGICKPSEKNGKLRIVFDASVASDNGRSLNECVYTGPKYQTDIFQILCNFRLHKYVFTSDIVKMYRRIKVNKPHTDFQRILWRRSEQDEIEHWRLVTLMDGINAAPYLALKTLEQLALDESNRFPKGAVALKHRYMDDFFVGNDSMNELVSIRDELIGILGSAGMSLDKWASNNPQILKGIAGSDTLLEENFVVERNDVVKTLGVNWNHKHDYYTFSISVSEITKFTRRALVSETAKIFDPCGWISPVTITLKTLFQKTWLENLHWDDSLPNSVRDSWIKIRSNLSVLKEVRIPRWIGTGRSSEIHGFCDASQLAYAAVVYVKCFDEMGIVSTNIIAARTKLSPLKQISIARLELCGAQLLAKLMRSIIPVFEGLKPNCFCWTDSKTVIAWLASHPSRWKTYVGNRCASIHELMPNIGWRYVKSELNPADIGSRGLSPNKLVESDLWWRGPSWLLEDWKQFYESHRFETQAEIRPIQMNEINVQDSFFVQFVERFSCFERFRRSFAYLLRFVENIRTGRRNYEPLSCEDISRSVAVFIAQIQRFEFKGYFDSARLNSPKQFENLSPFIDEQRMLRVGGRLANVGVNFDAKHPIIVPRGHFLDLLIKWTHERYYHAGLRLTMSLLKQKFYVSRMRNHVKRIIGNCVTCTRFKAKTYGPKMADLPTFRLNLDRAFEISGIDFAGPICVRPYAGRGKVTLKGYFCVIVCMATKAVNLEFVTSLSTESLILALRRFISRYGHCRQIFSDNGRNFVGCSRVFAESRKAIKESIESSELKNFLIGHLISWKFIPPYSPHFGGIWESCVKSVKFHLTRMFMGRMLTLEEMQTALLEISSVLNSRPLSTLSDDVEDLGVLTPSHFLTGYPSVCLPVLDQCASSKREIGRNVNVASITKYFWTKWKNEYLQEYMKRVRWKTNGKNPEIGDLVVVKRPCSYPGHWQRGRIIELIPSKDEITRVVKIRTANGIRQESVGNLVPIVLKHEASMGGV